MLNFLFVQSVKFWYSLFKDLNKETKHGIKHQQNSDQGFRT